MHITKRLYCSVLCLTVVLAGSAFGQGLTWESTTSGGSTGEKGTVSKNFAMPKKFKMVNASMTMILRMDKEVIYTLDPAKKTYTEDWVVFAKRMAVMSGRSGLSEAYMKIDGFPMETDMMLGETQMITTVTKMEKTSTASSEFDVPPGYTRIQTGPAAVAKQ
jgi:hypothetical protein